MSALLVDPRHSSPSTSAAPSPRDAKRHYPGAGLRPRALWHDTFKDLNQTIEQFVAEINRPDPQRDQYNLLRCRR